MNISRSVLSVAMCSLIALASATANARDDGNDGDDRPAASCQSGGSGGRCNDNRGSDDGSVGSAPGNPASGGSASGNTGGRGGADDPPGHDANDDRGGSTPGSDDPPGHDANDDRPRSVAPSPGALAGVLPIVDAISRAKTIVPSANVLSAKLEIRNSAPNIVVIYYEIRLILGSGSTSELCLDARTLGTIACPDARTATAVKVSLAAAIAAAEKAVPGRVIRATLELGEKVGSVSHYEVKVLLANGEDVTVLVDADTGIVTVRKP